MDKSFKEFQLVAKIASRFVKDVEAVMHHYSMEDKIVLTECLIQVTDLFLDGDEDCYDKAQVIFDELLKKYRSRLKPFVQASFDVYYNPLMVLAEKGIISSKEFNGNKQQGLSDKRFNDFLKTIIRALENFRFHYYLESEHPLVEEAKEGIKNNSSEFTTSRQLLTIYFLLKSLGVEPRSTVDIAPVTRFAHLITGTTFVKLQNSNLYKKLKKVPNFKGDKALVKDLEFIIPFFRELNLEDTVSLIEREINIAQKKRY